jgi:uncharacterized membrane protein YcjF (UPF0283 family)
MSKIDANELVDIFKEEVTKKAKKEIKNQKKKEKQLEKKENLEFERLAKQQEKKEAEEKNKEIEKETNREIQKENEPKIEDAKKEMSVFAFLYDTVFGFFLILLCLCTIGFGVFSIMKSKSYSTIIQVSLLSVFTLSYVISMTSKKEGMKKFTAILSSLAICLFMVYIFYIA